MYRALLLKSRKTFWENEIININIKENIIKSIVVAEIGKESALK